jgi:hypothetical protein
VQNASVVYLPDPANNLAEFMTEIGPEGLNSIINDKPGLNLITRDGILYSRRIYITPLRIVSHPPELDMTNRIIESFKI